LFNFHLDTVPAAAGWSTDPHRLQVRDDRAYGLGACDIKGAVAAMLAAASCTDGDLALLFSSDEEANDPRCIRGFLGTAHGFTEAVVAEPTLALARIMHRGIVSAQARFRGIAGHASERRALADNAIHRAVDWAQAALTQVRALQAARFEELEGMPFNLGRIEGGIKGNVIADACELRFGFRPLPSQAVDELLAMFANMAPPDQLAGFEELFRGPPLPAGRGALAGEQLARARELAATLGLPLGEAVNFWTEASLFSEAGLAALVFGPGDIAQAHTADEWVALAQLDLVARHYARIIGNRH
jgi:acetylornithine deacetylase